VNFGDIVRRLTAAVDFARKTERVRWDDQGREKWHAVYPDLSEGKPGLLGAVTSRAEAQVVRLAMLYTLLDQKDRIGEEQLQAALAVWE
jgi:hypothetical protein